MENDPRLLLWITHEGASLFEKKYVELTEGKCPYGIVVLSGRDEKVVCNFRDGSHPKIETGGFFIRRRILGQVFMITS